MKKTIIAIMAVGAALAAVSCNKTEICTVQESQKQDLILDLNIPSLGSEADTKAAKTAWAAGDKLNVWFDDWNPGTNTPDPDLIITFDGTKWTAGALKMSAASDGTARSLKASGKMTVVYEGYNDLSNYTAKYERNLQWFHPKRIAVNVDDIYSSSLVAYKTSVDYAYADNKLTATISDFDFYTQLKVLVKTEDESIKDKASDYALEVSYTDPTDATNTRYAETKGALVINPGSSYPDVLTGAANYHGRQAGVKESDGIAFYYVSFGKDVTNTDIKFTLYEIKTESSTSSLESLKTYTAKNKSFTHDGSKCQGVAINFTAFQTEE